VSEAAAARGGARVLVVDDETQLRRAVRRALEGHGYQVQESADGVSALADFQLFRPDVVLLDLMLPDIGGVEVCRRLRQQRNTPIIILSVVGDERTKVEALDQGADDYLTKPFGSDELLARIRVALRHRTGPPATDDVVLTVGDVVVDLARHTVDVDGRRVELTPKEFAFLALLARWPGRVLTHRTILQEVWGPEYGSESQYLRVYASQLRKKLGEDPARPRIVTEPGVGYRLVDAGGANER
jgi:two-component system KDP operon response regulator KdpE